MDKIFVFSTYNEEEIISNEQPRRDLTYSTWNVSYGKYLTLPKGSIEKLIGRPLSWADEPVELKEGEIIRTSDKCDVCGNHPNAIIQTQFGTYCPEHARYV